MYRPSALGIKWNTSAVTADYIQMLHFMTLFQDWWLSLLKVVFWLWWFICFHVWNLIFNIVHPIAQPPSICGMNAWIPPDNQTCCKNGSCMVASPVSLYLSIMTINVFCLSLGSLLGFPFSAIRHPHLAGSSGALMRPSDFVFLLHFLCFPAQMQFTDSLPQKASC